MLNGDLFMDLTKQNEDVKWWEIPSTYKYSWEQWDIRGIFYGMLWDLSVNNGVYPLEYIYIYNAEKVVSLEVRGPTLGTKTFMVTSSGKNEKCDEHSCESLHIKQ